MFSNSPRSGIVGVKMYPCSESVAYWVEYSKDIPIDSNSANPYKEKAVWLSAAAEFLRAWDGL
jgi:hypothetical protein